MRFGYRAQGVVVRMLLGALAVGVTQPGAAMGQVQDAGTRGGDTAPPQTIPPRLTLEMVPRNLRANPTGDGQTVRVLWQGQPSAFNIALQRESYVSNGWTSTTQLVANRAPMYDNPGPGQHRYRFFASETSNAGSWVTVSASGVQPLVPSVPSGVGAAGVGNLRALVSWIDTSDNETGFEIERNPAFSGGAVRVASNVTNYLDSTGTGQFAYRVRATGSAGNSGFSAWASVTIADINPLTPTNLSTRDAGNERDLTVSWQAASGNATSFKIERQTKAGSDWLFPATLTAPGGATTVTDTPGGGEHRYRISAINAVGQSAFSDWVIGTLASGWTALRKSPDTRVVYVSSSTGNDSFDGLSPEKARRTLAAAYALLRHNNPDWMLLRRGDTWNEVMPWWKKCGRSAGEPMVVATYGDEAARPLLKTGTNDAFSRYGGGGSPASIDFVSITGVWFQADRRAGDQGAGIYWIGAGKDILFEDCRFEGYATGAVVQSIEGRVERFTLRRSLILDSFNSTAHSNGLYAENVDGLVLEENVFDHNGWKQGVAEPTIFNHNVYVHTSNTGVVFRNNISLRSSSHGVQVRPGGIITGNVFARNAIGALLGGGDPNPVTHTNGITGTVDDNVILEGGDIGTLPRGSGIELTNVGASGATVRNNIIAGKSTSTDSPAIRLGAGGYGSGVGCMNITISGNTIHNWRGPLAIEPPDQGLAQRGHRIENNRFSDPQSTSPSQLIDATNSSPTTAVYSGNKYFSGRAANTWFDVSDTLRSYPQWVAQVSETGSTSTPIQFVDAARTLASYNATLGGASTFEAFAAAVREQSSRNWRKEYTAKPIRDYFKAGFTLR